MYELFTMEEDKNIQGMFEYFQTILNKLQSLGKNYDNYDKINKILRSLSRKWRSQVTTLSHRICDSSTCLFVTTRSILVIKQYLGILRFRESVRVVLA